MERVRGFWLLGWSLLILWSLTACSSGSGSNGILGGNAVSRIYIADTGNNRIVRVDDMTGSNRVVFGASGSGVGQFAAPGGIAVDAQGRIYVADTGNNRIVRMDDMQGANWTTFKGSGNNALTAPNKISLDTQGRLYITQQRSSSVRIDDMTGANWTELLLNPIGAGATYLMHETVPDAQYHLYAVRGNSLLVRKEDVPDTTWQTYDPDALFGHAPGTIRDIALDTRTRLYWVDSSVSHVARIDDISGANYVALGTQGSGTNQYAQPMALSADTQDRIYVADTGNNRIVRMDDMQGTNWTTFAGAADPLNAPEGVCIH